MTTAQIMFRKIDEYFTPTTPWGKSDINTRNEIKHIIEQTIQPQYETFDDWFNEVESFGLRSERFFQMLEEQQIASQSHQKDQLMRWLVAAFVAGTETKEKTHGN